MSTNEKIKLFNESYSALKKEYNDLHRQVVEIFASKLNEVIPIIEKMKKLNILFFHPDFGKDIRTKHGIIIGRDVRRNIIYVFAGFEKIHSVSITSDKPIESENIQLSEFLMRCDLELAMRGIEYIEDYLSTFIHEKKEKIQRTKDFIEKHAKS